MSSELFSVFECPNCKREVQEAKILPCNIYCKKCVQDILSSLDECKKEFKCEFCGDTHHIPKSGFTDFNFKSKFQPKSSIKEVDISESGEKLKANLKNIDSKIKEMRNKMEKSSDLISNHCLGLRNQVQLETEVLIKHLKDLSIQKIDEITDYEKKCLSIDTLNMEQTFIQEMEKFRNEWETNLTYNSNNEIEIQKANELSEIILKRVPDENLKLDLLLFDGSVME